MKHNYQYDLIIVSTEKMYLINRLTHEKVKGEITLHKAFNQTQVTVNEGRHAYRLVPGYINGIRQIVFDPTLAYFGLTTKNQLRLYRVTEQAKYEPQKYYSWGKDMQGRVYVYINPGEKRTYPGLNFFELIDNDNAGNQNLRISTEMEDPDNIDETWEYHLIKDNPVIYDENYMMAGLTPEGYLCLYKFDLSWRMWEYGSYSTDEYDRVFFTQPGESDRIYPYYARKDGKYITHPTKRNLTIPDRIEKGILKPEYYTKWWHERDSRTKIMDTTKEQDTMEQTKEISKELYDKLEMLGIVDTSDVRKDNVGQSNYAEHTIQPWSIWLDYKNLTPWDADIIKRILRTKDDKSMTPEQQRVMDYNKIIHICRERIRQIQLKEKQNKNKPV